MLRLRDELRATRERAVALATTFIYLDPHSDAPDDQTTMYCGHCGHYGKPSEIFVHGSGCLVGSILHDTAILPDQYIEYDLGHGLKGRCSHEEAAASRGILRFLVGAE